MIFKVPVTVLNMASAMESVQRILSFQIDINGDEIFTVSTTVTVQGDLGPPSPEQSPAVVSVRVAGKIRSAADVAAVIGQVAATVSTSGCAAVAPLDDVKR